MSEAASLWALFASNFLAASMLPGGPEMVLFGMLKAATLLAGAVCRDSWQHTRRDVVVRDWPLSSVVWETPCTGCQ